ncbi:MAG: acetolactate synthase large subunit [Dehalococcoidia bacterium]|nr:acetolactate synthase large subunit [Dehalococcoidia bacterium]
MRAADLLVRCLENEGVTYVFGVPGEEIMSLLDALADSSITFVLTRHEQGAALMADVYGRLTGRPGVCLATLGPGATNLMTGVADAFLDRAPLVAITGQINLAMIHKEAHQYVDTLALFHSITKWQARVTYPEVLPEVVRKAFKIAETEKPGPTHIELPEEVAAQSVEGEPLSVMLVEYPRPPHHAVQTAAELIAGAQRPMILAGNGVIRRRAAPQLREFTEKVGIPAANTFMSKGVMGYKNPLARLTVGLQNRDYEMCGLADADVVIAVGYDLVEFAPRLWNPRRDKRIIHIDTLPAEVDEHYLPTVEIVSEIGEALQALTAVCKTRMVPIDESRREGTVLAELNAYAHDQAVPLKPQRIVSDMRRILSEDDILISDVGAHKLWIARLFPAERPNTVIISNGFATMGIGVPGGIAAKLAQPERRVIIATGDGGFLMNVQELETARRLGTPFVTIVWVDGGYGSIRWKQEQSFGRTFGVDFGNPDIVKLAEAFGLTGFAVQRADDFAPALERALALDQPSVIAVPVDYSENVRLTETLGDVQVTI